MTASMLAAFALSSFAGGGSEGPIDLQSRVRSVPGPARDAVLYVSSGRVRAQSGHFFGPEVIYDNSCESGTYFPILADTERVEDTGQIPGPDNELLPGCQNEYVVNGFQIAYCTDIVGPNVHFTVGFDNRHANCDPAGLAAVDRGTFSVVFAPGIGPGSTAGLACWNLTIDLMNTSFEFPMSSDGDGTYDGDGDLDTFGFTLVLNNTSSTNTGFVIAGGPIHHSMGCDFGNGTAFYPADGVGSFDPQDEDAGTGEGSADSFGFLDGVTGQGCANLGGWYHDPWASFHLELYTEDAGCTSDPCIPGCEGSGPATNHVPCPCANNSAVGSLEGCLNTSGQGSILAGAEGTGRSISSDAQATGASTDGVQLRATQMVFASASIFLSGKGDMLPIPMGAPAHSGIVCVGGGQRVNAGSHNQSRNSYDGIVGGVPDNGQDCESSAGGTPADTPGTCTVTQANNTAVPGYYQPGDNAHFQLWYRDTTSPCPGASNFSSSCTVPDLLP